MTIYGQVVVGPPGSGKTTYCAGMCDFLRQIGRPAFVLNFDPANESLSSVFGPQSLTENVGAAAADGGKGGGGQHQGSAPPPPPPSHHEDVVLFDVMEDVVSLQGVMDKFGLGPNGGLIYCMEYIVANWDSVLDKLLEALEPHMSSESQPPPYLIFDFPGQVELFTHNTSVETLVNSLTHRTFPLGPLRLTLVNLLDSHLCLDPPTFISAVLLSLSTMLRLQLPAVHVLSKVDLLKEYGAGGDSMPYNLDFFTEVLDLSRLLQYLDAPRGGGGRGGGDDDSADVPLGDDPLYAAARSAVVSSPFHKRHVRLHAALVELVEDFGLVRFCPLDVMDAASVGRVLALVDRANGYLFEDFEADDDEEENGGGGGDDDDDDPYGQPMRIGGDQKAASDATTGGALPENTWRGKKKLSSMFKCAAQAEALGSEYEANATVTERYLPNVFTESIKELNPKETTTSAPRACAAKKEGSN